MEEKELQSKHIDKTEKINNADDAGVWLDEMSASWAEEDHSEPTLNKISFNVTPGELIVIVGKYDNRFDF